MNFESSTSTTLGFGTEFDVDDCASTATSTSCAPAASVDSRIELVRAIQVRDAPMSTLLRAKHTVELLAVAPATTARALEEIHEYVVLRHFQRDAEDLGLRRERVQMVTTVGELKDIVMRMRRGLQYFAWNTRRLAGICRWLLSATRRIQRFARRYVQRIQRRRQHVLRHWLGVVRTSLRVLEQQTREHVMRYRMPHQAQFLAEATELVLDARLDADAMERTVACVWAKRKERFCQNFRLRQGEGRKSVADLLEHAAGGMALVPAPAVAASPDGRLARQASVLASRTLTFRRLRLKRVAFDAPSLRFDPEHVSIAELCAVMEMLRERDVADSIAEYHRRNSVEDGRAPFQQPQQRGAEYWAQHVPWTTAEECRVATQLALWKEHRVPTTYAHALLTLDPKTQWFRLYCLSLLVRKRGRVVLVPSAGAPVPLVQQAPEAERIYARWTRAHLRSPSGAFGSVVEGEEGKKIGYRGRNGSDARPAGAQRDPDGQPRARCGFVVDFEPARSPSPLKRQGGSPPHADVALGTSPTDEKPPQQQQHTSPGRRSDEAPRRPQTSTRRVLSAPHRSGFSSGHAASSDDGEATAWSEALLHHRDNVCRMRRILQARAHFSRGKEKRSPPPPPPAAHVHLSCTDEAADEKKKLHAWVQTWMRPRTSNGIVSATTTLAPHRPVAAASATRGQSLRHGNAHDPNDLGSIMVHRRVVSARR